MNTVHITVPSDMGGERVDKVVAVLVERSRADVRRIIDGGGVTTVEGKVKPSDRFPSGTDLWVEAPSEMTAPAPDPEVPFDVLHEDDWLLVVDKPVGVVVHPGPGTNHGTLVNGLIARFPEIVGVGQQDRWGIVHRLDRDTSGLLVVARTTEAYEGLISMMRQRRIHRRYLTLVLGSFTNLTGTIDAPIGRDSVHRTRMRVTRDGRPSVSHYRKLAWWSSPDTTLLSVELETGRTHQIRVHMRSIDHPIVGDGAYGRVGVAGDPGRPWLHARQLMFDHPRSGKPISITSQLPTDLCDSLAVLGEPAAGSVADLDGAPL
ncbi:MAG: RluA family pseudouridine synthase [Acidimicrobiia bacterium]